MWSMCLCSDIAQSAEKMLSNECCGNGNEAWQEPPFISSFQGLPEIDREHHYCLRISKVMSLLATYQVGPEPPKSGKALMGDEMERLKAASIIATSSIMLQYSLLEACEADLFVDYVQKNPALQSKKLAKYKYGAVKDRMEILEKLVTIPDYVQKAYISLSIYRNYITHNINALCDDPLFSLTFHLYCQAIAYNISKALGAQTDTNGIEFRLSMWNKELVKFTQVIDFTSKN